MKKIKEKIKLHWNKPEAHRIRGHIYVVWSMLFIVVLIANLWIRYKWEFAWSNLWSSLSAIGTVGSLIVLTNYNLKSRRNFNIKDITFEVENTLSAFPCIAFEIDNYKEFDLLVEDVFISLHNKSCEIVSLYHQHFKKIPPSSNGIDVQLPIVGIEKMNISDLDKYIPYISIKTNYGYKSFPIKVRKFKKCLLELEEIINA